MIIEINPDWRIRSDPYNWIIEKRRKGGARERWNAVAYHGDLNHAIIGLARRRVQVLEGTYQAEALAPLCRALAALERDINVALTDVVTVAGKSLTVPCRISPS